MKKVLATIILVSTFAFAQSAKVQQKPQSPALKGVFPGTQHQVVLSWTASTTSGVTYNVWRGTTTGTETKYQSGISGVTYTDTAVNSGSVYYYYVTAQLGTTESSGSNEVNATIPTNPAPPTGLSATSQ